MSFRLFIYYCCIAGAWAAFIAWLISQILEGGVKRIDPYLRVALLGSLLGAFVGSAIGLVDGLLNDKGMQPFMRMMVCGFVGIFAGAIGGLVGNVLYRIMPLLFAVGWLLTGAMIGASVGVYDMFFSGATMSSSLRKLFNGVLGGLIGGAIGGLPFGFLLDLTGLPKTGVAMGVVALGAGIGLAIGLAQVFLTEAWIRVEEGVRAGKEIMLSKETTTIGRGEACDLGLFGDNTIERLHARVLLKNNRYLLEHAAEQGATYLNGEPVGSRPVPLNAGDEIQVGKCVLRFGERQQKRK
jgi:hypothetical protein